MKKKFLKLLLSAAAIALICNCGDTPVENDDTKAQSQAYIVNEPSFVYSEGSSTYIISQTTGAVTDIQGTHIGYADLNAGVIVDLNGALLASGIGTSDLTVVNPPVVTSAAWILSTDQVYVIYPDGNVTDENGNPVGIFSYVTDPATGLPAIDPETLLPITVGNIVALDGVTTIFADVDLSTLKVMDATVATSSASPDPVSSEAGPFSSANTPVSSAMDQPVSSSAKSSSSSAKSSSSVAQSSSAASSSSQASAFQIKYVNGGKSGSGYATRYWDCCKPHCAWPEHVNGGKLARTCDAQGNPVVGDQTVSMCDGGNAGICRNQFPIAVNDTLAFAFAATPGGENNCGKCFDLVFTGEGKYATDRHKKIKGKHLIVMSSNVGYDVAGGQFDVMIPGGGFGIFDGCSAKMGWGSQGAQYGGLLAECETETNYYSANYQKCLTNKCEKSFSSDPEAKEGCLFLANWMNAAGNPLLNYKEVECPQELLDRY